MGSTDGLAFPIAVVQEQTHIATQAFIFGAAINDTRYSALCYKQGLVQCSDQLQARAPDMLHRPAEAAMYGSLGELNTFSAPNILILLDLAL